MTEKRVGRPPKVDPNNRANRPRRSSAGAGKDRLNVVGELDPNYVYRTANDEGNRIEELKSYGYDVVQNEDVQYSTANQIGTGSTRSVVVDRRTGQKGVLMRQPREFHEEDAAAKENMLKEKEKSMFRLLETEDGRYGGVENTSSLAKAVED